jgi:hypothetical protein
MELLPDPCKLLPPHPVEGLHIILFVARCDEAAEQAWARVSALDWPAGTVVHVLSAQDSAAIVGWFGVQRFPALAAIAEGALLALEEGCEQGCALRLLEQAQRAVALFETL